jgi:tetratricopeptide (TPR) repeat protein
VAAAEAVTGRDPLIEAGLPHNLGAVHPDVARDLNALGALYHLAGRYGDADWAYRRALAAFEYCYGPDHVEIAMTCANLAVLDGDLGRFREAEALGRRALAIQQDVLGPGDTEVGLTLLNLAAAVAGQGRAGEATVLTVRAAAILGARRPADRPHAQVAAEALRAGGRRS